jgi:glycosyltransferase involved in cell wall biosynthesis
MTTSTVALPSRKLGTPLRIGVSCLQVDPLSVGGVNSYTLGLLEGFLNVADGHQFRIFVAPDNYHLFQHFAHRENCRVIVIGGRLCGIKKLCCRAVLLSHSPKVYKFTSDLLFEDARKVMDAEADILYIPTVVLQWFHGCKPTVLSMHDIQQVHHPEFFSWSRRLSRRITYGLSARYATYLQASSNYIKTDFLEFFRELSPDQIEVIPSGVNIDRFSRSVDGSDVAERYAIPERFLFLPAQLWPHKNHLTILNALKKIEQEQGTKIPLVMSGARFTSARKIFDFISENQMDYVHYLGKVSEDNMVALFQKADFMITATLHESSSLPILEACAAGTPVIASRIPPIEELAETLELNLFDPLDVNGLARLIYALWNDPQTAAAQAAANRRKIDAFSWNNTARRYVRLFEKIVTQRCETAEKHGACAFC